MSLDLDRGADILYTKKKTSIFIPKRVVDNRLYFVNSLVIRSHGLLCRSASLALFMDTVIEDLLRFNIHSFLKLAPPKLLVHRVFSALGSRPGVLNNSAPTWKS